MKQTLIILALSIFSISIFAQGNSKGKGNEKSVKQSGNSKSNDQSNKEDKDRADHEKKIWEGTYTNTNDGPKPSKNQPAKVRAAFQRDYPDATNVYWSKYRGDWTATFRNRVSISTAVYHANGDRKDTRTIITREQTPKVILDDIFKKRPAIQLGDIIRIEVPKVVTDIFRIKSIIDGKPGYLYYNADGVTIEYNY